MSLLSVATLAPAGLMCNALIEVFLPIFLSVNAHIRQVLGEERFNKCSINTSTIISKSQGLPPRDTCPPVGTSAAVSGTVSFNTASSTIFLTPSMY